MGSLVRRVLPTSRAACVSIAVVAGFAAANLAAAETGTPQVVVRNWDIDTGLPTARVLDVAHTPDGYVWLGTLSGLRRFDGMRFTTVMPETVSDPGGGTIRALAVDRAGTLWIGTEAGQVLVREPKGFRAVQTSAPPNARVNVIRAGPGDAIWIGTTRGIVSRHDGAWRTEGVKDGLAAEDVTHVEIDDAGRPWAVADGRLHAVENGRWAERPVEGVTAGTVSAIAAAGGGGVWCAHADTPPSDGRGGGVVRLHPDGRSEPLETGAWARSPFRGRIMALREDAAGRLWCATRGSGVACREPDGRWLDVGADTSLARADCTTVSIDPAGGAWIATRANGVYQALPTAVRALRLPDGAGELLVISVCGRADGSLWVGTDGGGVAAWQDEAWRIFGSDDGLPSLAVPCIAEGDGGRLHAGTSRGLVRLDGDRFVPVALPSGSTDAACACLFADMQDRLWVGTVGGMFTIRDGVVKSVPPADGGAVSIVAIAEDASGRLVAADRSGGLHEVRDGRLHPLRVGPEKVSRVKAIAADAVGGLWLGTYGGGIYQLSGTTSRCWTVQRDGLPSNHVVGLAAAADVMWAAADNGVFGFPIAAFTAAGSDGIDGATWRLSRADGLPEKGCTFGGQPAACRARDGSIWVATGNWLAGFDPADVMRPLRVSPPLVESLVVDGLEIVPDQATTIDLPAGTRRLEFHVASPNTVAPQRLRFRHRLAGFDRDWVEIAGRRTAFYTGLPPGAYRLEVQAAGPMGEWTPGSAATLLTLRPYLWQRGDARIAAGCAGAGVIALTAIAVERRRSRRRIEQLRLAQAREEERQRIARDIHDDLGSGLTEIVMLGDIAVREAGERPGADTIRQVAERARGLTRAMDEVVWAINPRNDTLECFITYFHRWAQAYLGNSGLRVRWDLPLEVTDTPLVAEDRHTLFLACKEAVTNVVKHAAAAEVCIRCAADSHGLEIVIADDGRGIAADPAAGVGDGLGNMRERLADIGGECDIDISAGGGTRVRFFVPASAASPSGRAG